MNRRVLHLLVVLAALAACANDVVVLGGEGGEPLPPPVGTGGEVGASGTGGFPVPLPPFCEGEPGQLFCQCDPGAPCSCDLGDIPLDPGGFCQLSCPAGFCSMDCASAGMCVIDCAQNCFVGCPPASSCDIFCQADCDVVCAEGSTCNVLGPSMGVVNVQCLDGALCTCSEPGICNCSGMGCM
ncbi:MAG: hypothetical protein KC731_15510 [Myxococcales bacterium]|nr:hypothetical protein [Myxococcales bacterium]